MNKNGDSPLEFAKSKRIKNFCSDKLSILVFCLKNDKMKWLLQSKSVILAHVTSANMRLRSGTIFVTF